MHSIKFDSLSMILSTVASTNLYSAGSYRKYCSFCYSTTLQQVDNVMCIDTEPRLSDCPRDIHAVSIPTATAVGMSCDPCELIIHTATVYEICYNIR